MRGLYHLGFARRVLFCDMQGWKGIQQHFLHELLEPFRSVIMQLVVRPKVWKALCAQVCPIPKLSIRVREGSFRIDQTFSTDGPLPMLGVLYA